LHLPVWQYESKLLFVLAFVSATLDYGVSAAEKAAAVPLTSASNEICGVEMRGTDAMLDRARMTANTEKLKLVCA